MLVTVAPSLSCQLGKDSVADGHDLNIDRFGPGQRPLFDFERQLRRGPQRQADFEIRIGHIHLQSNQVVFGHHFEPSLRVD